ncbi:MAG: hypothetical protein K2X41_06335 [Hyphomicrobium sp.]|nr:hypothetical protein [Hyphomicrobium sp.]
MLHQLLGRKHHTVEFDLIDFAMQIENFFRLFRALAIMGFVGNPTWAAENHDFDSGNFWLERCTATDAQGQVMCATYLRAVAGYNVVLTQQGRKADFCTPDGGTIGQVAAVVVKYLRDHPADLHRPFVSLVLEALSHAWPCAKTSN